jgi:hypothetical protein
MGRTGVYQTVGDVGLPCWERSQRTEYDTTEWAGGVEFLFFLSVKQPLCSSRNKATATNHP